MIVSLKFLPNIKVLCMFSIFYRSLFVIVSIFFVIFGRMQNVQAAVTNTVSIPTSSPVIVSDFVIQVTDLEKVGFTDVERILPISGRFEEPVRYFRVAEKIDTKDIVNDCSDCAHLVAVHVTSVFSTSTPMWVVRANPLITKVGGRLQLKWFAADRSITITAPGGEERIKKLGSWLRERAILGKNK